GSVPGTSDAVTPRGRSGRRFSAGQQVGSAEWRAERHASSIPATSGGTWHFAGFLRDCRTPALPLFGAENEWMCGFGDLLPSMRAAVPETDAASVRVPARNASKPVFWMQS